VAAGVAVAGGDSGETALARLVRGAGATDRVRDTGVRVGVLVLIVIAYLSADGFVYEDAHKVGATWPVWTWRPNRYLSDLLWLTHGMDRPGLAHAISIGLHLLNTWLVGLVAARWRLSAPLTMGVFGLHPMAIPAVAYLQGRPDVLMTTGALLAVLGAHDRRWLLAGAGVGLACVSKEAGIVAFGLIALAGVSWAIVAVAVGLSLGTIPMLLGLWRTADVTPWDWATAQASAFAQHLVSWAVPGLWLSMAPLRNVSWAALPILAFLALAWVGELRRGVLWVLIALSVRLLVPTPGSILPAHQLYLASVGLALVTVGLFSKKWSA